MEQNSFFPESALELQEILLKAKREKAHIQPYAAGYNWGYGETQTQGPNTWKVYFSKMKKIISFDRTFGVVRIQPGVTQGDLEKYLIENNLNYYVPNTGAGARGSILGNALERGFGIAPMQDHASSLLALRGFLADGTPYESSLLEVDRTLAECFSWGVGPQLDFLASQNSWIFISEASIQLIPKFPCTDLLQTAFSNHEMAAVADGLREMTQALPGVIGSIKMLHKKQVINGAMKTPKLLQKDWFLLITLYSNHHTRKGNLKAAKSILKASLPGGGVARFNRKRIDFILKLLDFLKFPFLAQLRTSIFDLSEFFRLCEGFTTEVGYKALDPRYNPEAAETFDMSQMTKRLAWFSPLCPLDATHIEKLLQIVLHFQQDAPCEFRTLTWTVLNPKTIALVSPLLFEKEKEKEFWEYYKKLHLELKKNGFIPYRFHVNMMPFLIQELIPKHFALARRFKTVLDPDQVLIPDKY